MWFCQSVPVNARHAHTKKLWDPSTRKQTTRDFNRWKPSCCPNQNKHGQITTHPDVRVSCTKKPQELRGSALGRSRTLRLFEVCYRTCCIAAASSKHCMKREYSVNILVWILDAWLVLFWQVTPAVPIPWDEVVFKIPDEISPYLYIYREGC